VILYTAGVELGPLF